MTEDEKMKFLLSHTIQVAGQIYAAAIGDDLRKTTVDEMSTIRLNAANHAVALIKTVTEVHLKMNPVRKKENA